jgi:hypothetical protein
MEFTYAAYAELIGKIRDNGYHYTNYKEYRNYEKSVILRHDIDTDINKAVELAEYESKTCNVKSTYFVLLTSNFYNVFSKKNRELLLDIRNMGHDIGLHFDELSYPEDSDITECIDKEVKILKQLLGENIDSVSMHRPSRKTLDSYYELKDGVINSYSTEFFKGFKYVSDSRRNWREDVEAIVESNDYNRLHILTHPFWYYEKEKSLENTITDWIKSASVDRYDNLNQNFTSLDNVVERRLFIGD